MRTAAEVWSVIVRLCERKAKLLGLDAPGMSGVEVITEEAVDAELAALARQVAANDAHLAELREGQLDDL